MADYDNSPSQSRVPDSQAADRTGITEQVKKVGCTILTVLIMIILVVILVSFLISLVSMVTNLVR